MPGPLVSLLMNFLQDHEEYYQWIHLYIQRLVWKMHQGAKSRSSHWPLSLLTTLLLFCLFSCDANFSPHHKGLLSCILNLVCQSNEKCMPALGSFEPRLVSSSYLISTAIIIQTAVELHKTIRRRIQTNMRLE